MNGNYGWGLPIQASTFAPDIDHGIYLIHAVMAVIFVIWGIFFGYLVIKYQKREGVSAEHPKRDGGAWALVPSLIILAVEIGMIGLYEMPAWSRMKLQAPKPEEANVISVVAEQFAWNAQYAGADGKFGRRDPKFIDSSNTLGLDPEDPDGKDDVVTLNELHVPVGKPTLINLSSKDVIHSFFIPEFRVKQDVVPGMRTRVWFTPTLAGTFELACAQLCGNAHATMHAQVIAQTPEEFDAWLKSQAKPAANP